MLLCHSLCYNEKYWASAPILMYRTKYILPFHDRENKHRQGVNDGSFQKHFRQPRNHRIRKTIPRHFRYSGYPHCCLYHILDQVNTRVGAVQGDSGYFRPCGGCHALKAEYDSLDSFQHHFRRHHCGYRCIPAGAAKGTGAAGQRKILHRLRQKL